MNHPCHYCGEPAANTKDHIVARAWLPKRGIPQAWCAANKVPACARCNNMKGQWRSDCVCAICEYAWDLLAPYILPRTKSSIQVVPIIQMVREGKL